MEYTGLIIKCDKWEDLVGYIADATRTASYELANVHDRIQTHDRQLMNYANMYAGNIAAIADRLYVIVDLLNKGYDKFNTIYAYGD